MWTIYHTADNEESSFPGISAGDNFLHRFNGIRRGMSNIEPVPDAELPRRTLNRRDYFQNRSSYRFDGLTRGRLGLEAVPRIMAVIPTRSGSIDEHGRPFCGCASVAI
jgi:hypothetical protein